MRKTIFAFSLVLIACFLTSCIYETPYWTPDGQKLLVGALYKDDKDVEQYQVFLVDTTTGSAKQITQFDEKAYGANPALSPDGRLMAYDYHEEEKMPENQFELWVKNLEDGSSKKIAAIIKDGEKGIFAVNPWSPDGKWLSYENFDPEKKISQIFITNLEGVSKAIHPGPGLLPSWSPDGKRIAYIVPRESDYDLVVIEVENLFSKVVASKIPFPTEQANFLLHVLVPSWSQDGENIAYVSGDQIAILNLKSGEPKILTQGLGHKIWPKWSPNSQKIAFMNIQFKEKDPLYGSSLSEILLINSDGTETKQLTQLGGEAYLPQWSPTGDRLSFLFAHKEVAFLPATVDLDGAVKFFPINEVQKLNLAKYKQTLFSISLEPTQPPEEEKVTSPSPDL